MTPRIKALLEDLYRVQSIPKALREEIGCALLDAPTSDFNGLRIREWFRGAPDSIVVRFARDVTNEEIEAFPKALLAALSPPTNCGGPRFDMRGSTDIPCPLTTETPADCGDFVTVPREPTTAMLAAAVGISWANHDFQGSRGFYADIIRAALAAEKGPLGGLYTNTGSAANGAPSETHARGGEIPACMDGKCRSPDVCTVDRCAGLDPPQPGFCSEKEG